MKNTNYNISPETIEYYMQKGRQERSDSIYKMYKGIKSETSRMFRRLSDISHFQKLESDSTNCRPLSSS